MFNLVKETPEQSEAPTKRKRERLEVEAVYVTKLKELLGTKATAGLLGLSQPTIHEASKKGMATKVHEVAAEGVYNTKYKKTKIAAVVTLDVDNMNMLTDQVKLAGGTVQLINAED